MTLNEDRKQTKYGHMRWEHMTHTTEPWHNSPLPEGVSHAVTVPPGRGVGALEAPQDKHGQEHRTGTSRAEQTDKGGHGGAGSSGGHAAGARAMAVQGAQEAMAVQGAQEAMAGGPCGRGLGPLGPAPTAGTLLPPQKNFPEEVRGYQEPSGAKQTGQYKMTGKPSRARQTGQDSPQEQEALQG